MVSAAVGVLRAYARVFGWFARALWDLEVRLAQWYVDFSVTRVLPWLSRRWAGLRQPKPPQEEVHL